MVNSGRSFPFERAAEGLVGKVHLILLPSFSPIVGHHQVLPVGDGRPEKGVPVGYVVAKVHQVIGVSSPTFPYEHLSQIAALKLGVKFDLPPLWHYIVLFLDIVDHLIKGPTTVSIQSLPDVVHQLNVVVVLAQRGRPPQKGIAHRRGSFIALSRGALKEVEIRKWKGTGRSGHHRGGGRRQTSVHRRPVKGLSPWWRRKITTLKLVTGEQSTDNFLFLFLVGCCGAAQSAGAVEKVPTVLLIVFAPCWDIKVLQLGKEAQPLNDDAADADDAIQVPLHLLIAREELPQQAVRLGGLFQW
ncbi:hypothetical protein TYRP_006918 [Tyrophagus putrescentiae]|nr:hypothetical protein TYRP_006918 [Tyrophagus putrescentiae]